LKGWEHRFSWTAWGIRSIRRADLNPFSAEVPVLGPPWKVPFEFPLYQWFAAVTSTISGWSETYTGRATAALFFVLSAYATYRLAVLVTSTSVALTGITLYLFCAYSLNWGTEIMPDFTAVLFSVVSLEFFLRFIDSHRHTHWMIAVGAGALGALAKITTATLIIGVALGLLLLLRFGLQKRAWVTMGLALAGCLPALVWNQYADRIKANNVHTAYTTSRNLASWQFGPWRDRVEMSAWQTLLRHSFEPIVGSVLVAVGVWLLALTVRRWRPLVSSMGLSMMAGPAVFAGLYFSHDHYFIASLPFFAIITGIALVAITDKLISVTDQVGRHLFLALATLGLILLSWTSPEGVENMNRLLLRQRAFVGEWTEVREVTLPDDHLIVIGLDTNPSLLFDVDRKGLMLRPEGTRPDDAELGTFYEYVYWAEPNPTPEQWAEYFPAALRHEEISPNFHRIFPLDD
jgi:4-amino-4-deoxy-L-arabinose transferase-like glycosyltransferase